MAQYFYTTAFKPVNEAARHAVAKMKEDLDRRKSGLKNASDEQIERTLAGFLTQGKHPYEVLLKHVPEEDKDAVRDATECLVRAGWLNRTQGKFGYQLNPDIDFGYLKFQSVEDQGQWRIETATGLVCLDDSYLLRPLQDLRGLNHRKLTFLAVPNPDLQLCWLQGWLSAPSRRWYEVPSDEPEAVPHPEDWPAYTKLIQHAGNMRGRLPFVPYEYEGQKGWLTHNITAALRVVEQASFRHWGRRCSPLLISQDPLYMRKCVHPGLQH
jgi:hypothetical protein